MKHNTRRRCRSLANTSAHTNLKLASQFIALLFSHSVLFIDTQTKSFPGMCKLINNLRNISYQLFSSCPLKSFIENSFLSRSLYNFTAMLQHCAKLLSRNQLMGNFRQWIIITVSVFRGDVFLSSVSCPVFRGHGEVNNSTVIDISWNILLKNTNPTDQEKNKLMVETE